MHSTRPFGVPNTCLRFQLPLCYIPHSGVHTVVLSSTLPPWTIYCLLLPVRPPIQAHEARRKAGQASSRAAAAADPIQAGALRAAGESWGHIAREASEAAREAEQRSELALSSAERVCFDRLGYNVTSV